MKKLVVTSLFRASQIRDAAADDRGGVAAEYGVLLAGIVGVVAIAAAALGGRIGGLFDSILPGFVLPGGGRACPNPTTGRPTHAMLVSPPEQALDLWQLATFRHRFRTSWPTCLTSSM